MISLQRNNDRVPILGVLEQKYDAVQMITPEHTTSPLDSGVYMKLSL